MTEWVQILQLHLSSEACQDFLRRTTRRPTAFLSSSQKRKTQVTLMPPSFGVWGSFKQSLS